MNQFFIFLTVIIVVSIIGQTVVGIIKAAKSQPGGKAARSKLNDMEKELADLDSEVQGLRERVEVLEKIVTDDRYQLDKDIEDLAG